MEIHRPPRLASPLGWLLLLAFLTSGCAGDVTVSRGSPAEVRSYLTQSAISSDKPSALSLVELRRYELLDQYADDPDATLARLHDIALAQGFPADSLFALAELSFLRAEHTHDRGRYGAAAVYAYAFLFPEEEREPLGPLDPRGRTAADLYNRALTLAFRSGKDESLQLAGAPTLELPFGRFTGRTQALADLGGYEIENLKPATDLVITGLRNRYRRAGIGVPLAAALKPTAASRAQPVPLGPHVRMPLTAVVRIDAPLAQLKTGDVTGQLDVFWSLDVDALEIDGRAVALEAEPSAALAMGLSESGFWKLEIQRFLGDAIGLRRASGIGALRPYREGRIPAVFVHGTGSSPARWADMVNDLMADPRLRHRYAFWFFYYDSGNPVAYSAWQLRDALAKAVARADPDGSDPCLGDMIVLGHSQGGLLTKMTAIDSGDAFWNAISSKPLDQTHFSEANKELLQHVMFVKPLPFVHSVIFLATPHRGSYLAGPQIVRRLFAKLVRLPSDIIRVGAGLAALAPAGALSGEQIPTSIDNMSPGNPFIQALAKIPVAPGVTAHSIISVDDDKPLDEAGDGVVKYESAHVEGVASELIVHSPHSGMQSAPPTIEEVRRIFLEHAAASSCPPPAVVAAPETPETPETPKTQKRPETQSIDSPPRDALP